MTSSGPPRRHRPRRAALLALLLAGSPALGACSGGADGRDGGDAVDAAGALAQALSAGDLGGLGDQAFAGIDAAEASADYSRVVAGMGEVTPQVVAGDVTEGGGDTEDGGDDADRATAELRWTWPVTDDQDWTYATTVPLSRVGGEWRLSWSHAVVVDDLPDDAVLDLTPIEAARGDVVGAGGQRLVTQRPVTRVGLDKSTVPARAVARSATALARLVGIDPAGFRKAVAAAGDRAYVEAITYRRDEVPRAVQDGYGDIDGTLLLSDERALAPTRDFAAPLLGSVGPVTAEMIADDPDRYAAGEEAGLSGLEARYDEQLAGSPGVVVSAVAADGGGGSSSSLSAELVRIPPVAGTDLRLTLDLETQRQAETSLGELTATPSALVALRPSTGEILAAANGPGNGGQNLATFGQYAPGSTFKIVSSLALLRAGLTPDTPVACTPTVTVDGRVFENYDDYPAGGTGQIPLRTAVANSCNTAFISTRDELGDAALGDAAAALGLGVDHDVGFPAYFGSVPPAETETGRAADMIGQGTVLASPMAMAAVIGTVQQGTLVVPRLVADLTSPPPDRVEALTRSESRALQGMLRGVVTSGSGSLLGDVPGPPVIAKTGTAEYERADGSTGTHAWMVAAQGDLAVAVFVGEGASGSGTAGPVLEEFLRTTD